ncbi:extended synaptotagmin-2 isoform X2 [Triplophysa dalaica]|uniref:extended synaptotagmin-2 isoform X2 n=1 Tax=Triplophysa dalaica TaxID=1582913 RepID=UPI0024DFB288|nr:extended synaptotagmin-2 isoform X2 [Triplophysa dalaica]
MSASVNGVNPKPGPAVSPNGPSSVSKPGDVGQLEPVVPDEEPQTSVADATQMGIKFAKTFLLIFPIYVLGYLEFSFSWVLIGLAALFWLKRNRGGERFARVNQALAFLEQEERTVRQSVQTSELPPWVHFPDVERVEWLNKTVQQMWPYICQFVEKLFKETIEPAVQGAHAQLSTFTFSKIDMGDKPLRIDGVKVYTENVDRRQIIMDLQISFVGNTEIDVDIKKYYCRAGIKSIQLNGVLRVIMDPLLGDMPLVGALSVFFLKKPFLDINWTGLTNMLDIPGINGLSDGIIQDIIYSYLVLPNKINIPLLGEAEIANRRFPMPKAVLRIHFLEAQDLIGKDKFLGGLIKGKSDPYGIIQLGSQLFKSKVIKESVNPKWNAVYEAFVYDHQDQNLEIELFDEDPDKDDFLGSIKINVDEIEKEGKVDQWFDLNDVATGKLHLKLQWLSLLSTPDRIDEVLSSIKADKGQANDGLSSALLLVHLDSAKNLPSGKKVISEPCPLVQFTVGHKSYESKIRYKTTEPVWEEAFIFLIHNPKTQDLEVEVKDEKRDCSMGTITYSLSKLMLENQMTVNERFLLKNSGPGATLKMKMALRVFCSETLTVPNPSPSVQSSTAQVRRPSTSVGTISTPHQPAVANPAPTPTSQPIPTSKTQPPTPRTQPPTPTPSRREQQTDLLEDSPFRLTKSGRSASSLAISGSQLQLNSKEPTPSIASDISNPSATLELQRTIQQLQNGSTPGFAPLGEIQLTIRHSSQRNKLIVVVHACRNLISSSQSGSEPYVRLYLLPDKRRSGRRKTNTLKKTVNPIYDQTFEFSVSLVELLRRTLDVAVKNGGGILSKNRGLLGKVLVDLNSEDISKSFTQWYELTVDGQRRSSP